jgi:hypothetical protein
MRVSTRQKITLTFSLLAGVLILFSTTFTFLIIKYSIDAGSYKVLEEQLQKFSQQAKQQQVVNKDQSYQKQVSASDSRYYNISNIVYNQNKLDESTIGNVSSDNLDASKEVYSRLIAANGDIKFTSDLFETYQVSNKNSGRREYNYGSICIHSYTVQTTDKEIIQVARYCPLSQESTNQIIIFIILASVVVIVCTYIFGLILATILLRPLEKEVNVHKVFIQDARHELLTPLSVAMSSVDATMVSKQYEEGLLDLKSELKSAINVLDILVKKYINKDKLQQKDQVDLREIINSALKKREDTLVRKNLEFIITGDAKVNGDQDIVKTIFRNLIDNSVDHSTVASEIHVNITKSEVTVSNHYDTSSLDNASDVFKRGVKSRTSDGKGIGLALTKELVTILGWKISASREGDIFKVGLRIN